MVNSEMRGGMANYRANYIMQTGGGSSKLYYKRRALESAPFIYCLNLLSYLAATKLPKPLISFLIQFNVFPCLTLYASDS